MAKVTANWLREFQMQINDGRHQWLADEPEEVGGSDVGPNPFDMLLGAAAACACFFAKRYAVTSKLPVQDVIAEAQGDWVKEPDSEEKTYRIKVEVKVKGDLSEKDLARLLRAAESCALKQAVVGLKDVKCSIAKI